MNTRRRQLAAKPKPAPRARLVGDLPRAGDTTGIQLKGNMVVKGAEDHPELLPNPPHIPPLKTSLAALDLAIKAAQNGGRNELAVLTADETAARNELVSHTDWVRGLVRKATPEQALVIITAAGYDVGTWGAHRKPLGPSLKSTVAGTVLFDTHSIYGAVLYCWEMSADQKAWTLVLQTTHTHGVVDHLPSGTAYFRFRVYLRSNTYTEWVDLPALTIA